MPAPTCGISSPHLPKRAGAARVSACSLLAGDDRVQVGAGRFQFADGLADPIPVLDQLVDQFRAAGHQQAVVIDDFPGDASTIVSAAAILDDVIDTVRANGLDGSVLSAGRAAVQRAIDAGYGSAGFSRLAVL